MSAYLEEHLPLLRSLHASLGLPVEVLNEDQTRIDTAIKAVVVSIVKEREVEVENWKDAIGVVKRQVGCLRRAMGDRKPIAGPEAGEGGVLVLPSVHQGLVDERERLEAAYRERLQRIQALHEALTALATLLGEPFEIPKPLQAIAGSSTATSALASHPPRESTSRRVSGGNTSFKPETAEERSRNSVGSMRNEDGTEVYMDVGEELVQASELYLTKATEERDLRRNTLIEDLFTLRWLYHELALPPFSLTNPSVFPQSLLPDRTKEETPGARMGYEKLFAKFLAANPLNTGDTETDEVEVKGLGDLQPEVGLIAWVAELGDVWNKHKERCEARIQELFNQIEPHWNRMEEVDQDYMDAFFDVNRGSGEAAIAAYEAELERVLELRRASLSSFMVAIRKEIEDLWAELMFSEEEKGMFFGFIDDDFTEELLTAHEEYVELLRAEIESKAPILPKVREWYVLVQDEEELERSANDPNRFKMRGGAMLREEKLRKRVGILKPRIESELLTILPEWETEMKKPFMIQGVRIVDKIYEELETKEAAKEAKKRARQGLGPTKTVRATPAPATARSQPNATARKRTAPEATPLAAYGTTSKKPRVMPISSMKPLARLPGTGTGTIRSIKPIVRTVQQQQQQQQHRSSPSPTPCPLPRPGRSVSSTSSSTFGSTTMIPPPGSLRLPSGTLALAKAGGRRPPRESFRPRQSVLPAPAMLLGIARLPSEALGEVNEEEDNFTAAGEVVSATEVW